jgi:hypothetical protein
MTRQPNPMDQRGSQERKDMADRVRRERQVDREAASLRVIEALVSGAALDAYRNN